MASTNHTADKLSEEAKAPVLARCWQKDRNPAYFSPPDILSVLEKLDINAEQIEHIYDTIESMGIQIVAPSWSWMLPRAQLLKKRKSW